MKKIVKVLAIMLVLMFALSGCKVTTTNAEPAPAQNTYVSEQLNEYVNTFLEGATVSEKYSDIEHNGRQYRAWNAEKSGVKFQIVLPLEYAEVNAEDEEAIEVPDSFGDNYGYLIAKDIMKQYPELGEITADSEFSNMIITETEASAEDLTELWGSYSKAKAEVDSRAGESLFVEIKIDEENTVEFTPFSDWDEKWKAFSDEYL